MAVGFAVALCIAFALLAPGLASAQPLACGQTITRDTTLHADLGPCPGDGLVIGAANVTVDLNGHAILGDDTGNSGGDVGVGNETGYDGTVIENGAIRGFFFSIKLDAADHSQVSDIASTASGSCCQQFSVQVLRSTGSQVENNTFDNAETPLVVSGSHNSIENNASDFAAGDSLRVSGSHNSISRNVARYSTFDMVIDGSLNRITHNDVQAINGGLRVRGTRNLIRADTVDGFDGITVAGPGNVIRDNVVPNPETSALLATDCRNVRVEGNRLASFGSNAIQLTGCQDARVEGNTVPFAGSFGIQLDGGWGNLIRQNTVSATYYSGIFVGGGSVGTVVKGNLATRAGFNPSFETNPESDGIQVEDAGTTIADNRANDNADYGIQAVPGVIDGGGNTASGNGNPLQCLNVVCN
jgi:parallel beta-helix repeat protein